MARIEKEESRRYLSCPVCEHQWVFPRFECPFCHAVEKEHQFLTSDTFPHHRVDLCSECKVYIKTIFEKEQQLQPFPFLDDLVTGELDAAAQEKGYIRKYGYFSHVEPE